MVSEGQTTIPLTLSQVVNGASLCHSDPSLRDKAARLIAQMLSEGFGWCWPAESWAIGGIINDFSGQRLIVLPLMGNECFAISERRWMSVTLNA